MLRLNAFTHLQNQQNWYGLLLMHTEACAFISCVCFMHPSILCPTTPLPGPCQERDGDLNFAKFKCTTYWACQSIKSLPSPHLKHEDLRGDLLVNVHTSVHAYGERSNSPSIGQVLVSNQSQMLHLSLYIAQEGGSGT